MQKLFFTIVLLLSILTIANLFSCKSKGACDNVVCFNGGSCFNGKCVCPVGYEGATCDTLSRDKFIYNYSGGDSCGINLYAGYYPKTYTQYQLRMKRRLFNNIEFLMLGFLNNPYDSAICTMLKTDSFSFIGSNNATSYTGSGWLRQDTLRLQYQVLHDTSSYQCTYLGQINY